MWKSLLPSKLSSNKNINNKVVYIDCHCRCWLMLLVQQIGIRYLKKTTTSSAGCGSGNGKCCLYYRSSYWCEYFNHFTLFATQTDHPSPPPSSLLRKWIFIFYVASLHPPCGDMFLVQSKITRGERQSII